MLFIAVWIELMCIYSYLGSLALHNSHTRVSGAQVHTNNGPLHTVRLVADVHPLGQGAGGLNWRMGR